MTQSVLAAVAPPRPPGAAAARTRARSYARAALFSTPSTWQSPASPGPSVHWYGGAGQRAMLGPRSELGLSTWSQRVGAGERYAYAELTGISFGPICVQRLMAGVIDGIPVLEIDGDAGGSRFRSGQRLEIEGLSVDVGQVERPREGRVRITGLAIGCPDGRLLTLAVIGA